LFAAEQAIAYTKTGFLRMDELPTLEREKDTFYGWEALQIANANLDP
jgi:hypothetical protein